MPHQFYGNAPGTEGTTVSARIGDVEVASTTVDSLGRYGYAPTFKVPGTAGATVEFYVGGVLANETAIWQSGAITRLDPTLPEYDCWWFGYRPRRGDFYLPPGNGG
jgi:hypothetical protein